MVESDKINSTQKEREWEVSFECPGDSSLNIAYHTFQKSLKARSTSELPSSIQCPKHPKITAISIGIR